MRLGCSPPIVVVCGTAPTRQGRTSCQSSSAAARWRRMWPAVARSLRRVPLRDRVNLGVTVVRRRQMSSRAVAAARARDRSAPLAGNSLACGHVGRGTPLRSRTLCEGGASGAHCWRRAEVRRSSAAISPSARCSPMATNGQTTATRSARARHQVERAHRGAVVAAVMRDAVKLQPLVGAWPLGAPAQTGCGREGDRDVEGIVRVELGADDARPVRRAEQRLDQPYVGRVVDAHVVEVFWHAVFLEEPQCCASIRDVARSRPAALVAPETHVLPPRFRSRPRQRAPMARQTIEHCRTATTMAEMRSGREMAGRASVIATVPRNRRARLDRRCRGRASPTFRASPRATSCEERPISPRSHAASLTETMSGVIACIPARFGSTRLPGKPLLPVDGEPMIAHVVRARAQRSVGHKACSSAPTTRASRRRRAPPAPRR